MKHQAYGLSISFLIHTLVIVLAVVIGTTSASMNTKPVVIDLSILESIVDSRVSEAPGALKMPVPKKAKVIEKPKRVQRIREVEKEVDKEAGEPEIVTPVERQGPVPIASAGVAKTEPLTEGLPGTGDQLARGTGIGEGGGSGGAGNGAGGISADALRKKYLSEHFAYIKDIIQKNITYPQIARRMGWQGKVIIAFIILENGIASDIKIAQGSGYEVLDANVIKTVKKVNPFPKPPVEAKVKIPITYRLSGF